jgi:predicted metal-binding membrane protein
MADSAYDARTRPVVVTLCIAAACWVIAVMQMRGMDMGVDTTLGSFGFFVGVWAAMMAAMMLPGAVPAAVDYARTHRGSGAAALFVAAYVVVWTLFGIAAYGAYRPHSTTAAGFVTVTAGLYELTPVKRQARQRCQQRARSGFHFGLHCLGSSIGLMALLLALGAMSVAWMTVIAVLVLVQKLVKPRLTVDRALALAIVAFGVVILIDPSSVPGLVPSM